MTNYDSRVTADVDFLLWQMPNTPEKLRAVLEEIISTDTGNDFIFTFDEAVLSEALKKTFINRGRRFTMEQFRQIMTFEADDGMQKKWRAFTKKIGAKEIDFKNVLETIRTFPEVPFQAAVSVS